MIVLTQTEAAKNKGSSGRTFLGKVLSELKADNDLYSVDIIDPPEEIL
jgi:hypothetical protein